MPFSSDLLFISSLKTRSHLPHQPHSRWHEDSIRAFSGQARVSYTNLEINIYLFSPSVYPISANKKRWRSHVGTPSHSRWVWANLPAWGGQFLSYCPILFLPEGRKVLSIGQDGPLHPSQGATISTAYVWLLPAEWSFCIGVLLQHQAWGPQTNSKSHRLDTERQAPAGRSHAVSRQQDVRFPPGCHLCPLTSPLAVSKSRCPSSVLGSSGYIR